MNLEESIHIIKTTCKLHENSLPYFFIVGAGISVPEIPTANGIITMCKDYLFKTDREYYELCEEKAKEYVDDPMKYYSAWIGYAYPNRIDRSIFFKKIIADAKISSANLMLAQILNSNKIARTVFTPNFDNSIKKSLDLIGANDYFVSENAMDNLVVNPQSQDIQIVHVHGTYNFYDCANLDVEINTVAEQSGTISSYQLLSNFLSIQAPIIVGYSGWENDVIMRSLKERLSYPTPLRYLWVCYDVNSYNALPEWLKNNPNVAFVLPNETGINEQSPSSLFADGNCDESLNVIDATQYLGSIISALKISPPLLFTNPYSYYSEMLNKTLPENEDVLHLRNWAQRMEIIEENESTFDQLIRKIEEYFISKDYGNASQILINISDLELTKPDSRFVCRTIIRDFLKNENIVVPFDERYTFYVAALDFVDKFLDYLIGSKTIIGLLYALMQINFRVQEKEKYLFLINKINTISERDPALLEITLATLGVKSSFVCSKEQFVLLKSLIERCPDFADNKRFEYLKCLALFDIIPLLELEAALSTYSSACSIADELSNKKLQMRRDEIKVQLIPRLKDDLKVKWTNEILDLISERKNDYSYHWYIQICAMLENIGTDELLNICDESKLERILLALLEDYEITISHFDIINNFSQCCNLLCSITKDPNVQSKYCLRIFGLQHNLSFELYDLYDIAIIYFALPNDIISYKDKIEQLEKIKLNKNTNNTYYRLLMAITNDNMLPRDELNSFDEDIHLNRAVDEKLSSAMNSYHNGDHIEAERLFASLVDCRITYISNIAKANLAYMVRRKETFYHHSFWDLIDGIKFKDPIVLINIILYCISTKTTTDPRCIEAFRLLDECEDMEECIGWWSNIDLVGTEESALALSIINKEYDCETTT